MSCASRAAANSCRVGTTLAHFCNFAHTFRPSGAGKSTLINALAHTASGPSLSGLRLTGSVTSHPKMMRLPAYVKQDIGLLSAYSDSSRTSTCIACCKDQAFLPSLVRRGKMLCRNY